MTLPKKEKIDKVHPHFNVELIASILHISFYIK